jgi:hypothetical protein
LPRSLRRVDESRDPVESTRVKTLLASFAFLALASGCGSVRTVVAPTVPSEAPTMSRVAAAIGQAAIDNALNPPGHPREAVALHLRVAAAGMPAPFAKDLDAAASLSALVYAGKMDEALRRAAVAESEVAKLRGQVDVERAASAAKLAAEIARIRSEADAKTRRLISFIFFGGSALSVAAGVLMLTVLSGVPIVGPKLIAGAFILAAILSATGIAILKAMDHPWIVWTGLAVAAAVLIALGVLAYANNWHAKKTAA